MTPRQAYDLSPLWAALLNCFRSFSWFNACGHVSFSHLFKPPAIPEWSASSNKAAHEMRGFWSFLSSLSAPQRAPPVCPCGPALWLSVCRFWFWLGHGFYLLFCPASRGAKKGRECLLPPLACRGSRKKSRLFRLIFSGGPSPGGRRSRGRACVGRAEGYSAPAMPARAEGACQPEDRAHSVREPGRQHAGLCAVAKLD
jgi:hypothetical protein